MKKTQTVLILALSFLLSACNDNLNYRYFLMHPEQTNKIYDDCQSGDAATKDSRQCLMILNLMTNYSSISTDAMSNPEGLGQRVINIENEYVKLKNEYALKQKAVEELKQKNDTSNIQLATDEMNQLQKECVAKKDELDLALAILGLNSPE